MKLGLLAPPAGRVRYYTQRILIFRDHGELKKEMC